MRHNSEITAPQVKLIGEHGELLGIVSKQYAMSTAESSGLDLVEVSPKAEPPICKLMDYGKFLYEKKKNKKKQVVQKTKEIKLTPNISDHDLDTKVKSISKFLSRGDKVKLSVKLKGRQLAHPEIAKVLLAKIAQLLGPQEIVLTTSKSSPFIIYLEKTNKKVA